MLLLVIYLSAKIASSAAYYLCFKVQLFLKICSVSESPLNSARTELCVIQPSHCFVCGLGVGEGYRLVHIKLALCV